jgi:uncharacterized protein (DUF433 family)
MSTTNETIKPRLGEGVYTARDISKILNLDYEKVYRWLVGYWSGGLDESIRYTFGEDRYRAVNFFSLIEFFTFFKLREKGVSSTSIKRLHCELSALLGTKYPFAIAQDYYIEKRNTKKTKKTFIYYTYLDSLIKLDRKQQFYLKFLNEFLEKVEFDDNNLAARFFPLSNSKNVVVDPKHQFGQPVVTGTNIRTETLYNLFKGGEKAEDISILYNIPLEKVKDAIAFQNAA